MGPAAGSLQSVAELIHLAVAPIFLLTGIATTLVVFLSRLARIVDRGRFLESRSTDDVDRRKAALDVLARRAHLIYRALSLGVLSALCVCLLMTLAFAGPLFRVNVARPVAGLFLLALFSYTTALLFLLREVFLALGNFKLELREAVQETPNKR